MPKKRTQNVNNRRHNVDYTLLKPHKNQYIRITKNTEKSDCMNMVNGVTTGKNNPIYQTLLTVADHMSYIKKL